MRTGGPDDFVGPVLRIVREHTIQGFFGDPAYGGNRDVVGWKLVGSLERNGGTRGEQMQTGVDARAFPILTIQRPLRPDRSATRVTEKFDVIIVGLGSAGGISPSS